MELFINPAGFYFFFFFFKQSNFTGFLYCGYILQL